MIRRLTYFGLGIAAATFLTATSAWASTITLGAALGDVILTPTGSGTFTLEFSGSCSSPSYLSYSSSACLTGTSLVDSTSATYALYLDGPLALNWNVSAGGYDIYGVDMGTTTLSFAVYVDSGNVLTGTLSLYSLVQAEGSAFTPALGSLTVTSATGLFASNWSVDDFVDSTLTFGVSNYLLYLDSPTTGSLANGSIEEGTSSVPEPAGIALAGFGLLALGGWRRYGWRRARSQR